MVKNHYGFSLSFYMPYFDIQTYLSLRDSINMLSLEHETESLHVEGNSPKEIIPIFQNTYHFSGTDIKSKAKQFFGTDYTGFLQGSAIIGEPCISFSCTCFHAISVMLWSTKNGHFLLSRFAA